MQNKNIPFVWTEIGRNPGKYVFNAINVNSQLFPDQPRYLILSKDFSEGIKGLNCEVIYEELLGDTKNSKQFWKTPKNWSWSQNNYWTNTTRRFFILEQFLEKYKLEKLIHMESDTILLNKKYIDELYEIPNWGIKYTKQDATTGCASVFLVNSLASLKDFNSFVLENWADPTETDMSLLSKYQNLKSHDSFLPSGDLNIFDTVFDAGTIGRYFLGGDARNNRFPFSTRGLLPNTREFFDPSRYVIESDGDLIKLVDKNLKSLNLACVHIHSKRIPKNLNKLVKSLIKESNVKRTRFWKLGVLDLGVINERTKSFIQRRIMRNKVADPRIR